MMLRAGMLLLAGVSMVAAADNDILCLPSAPSGVTGSSVTVSVWYGPPTAGLQYQWSPSLGAILRQDDHTFIWDLKNAPVGQANADLDIKGNGATKASCSVALQITGDKPAETRGRGGYKAIAAGGGEETIAASGFEFIVRGPKGFTEPADRYGLYSYILFGSKPKDEERERYLAIFNALLRLIKPLRALEGPLSADQLNATRIPVLSNPAQGKPEATPEAAWMVDNYDYNGATGLLAGSGVPHQADGIYIVSVKAPLTGQAPVKPYLVLDFSKVPGTIASTWVNVFLNQAAQVRFWDTDNLQYFVANLRKYSELTSPGVPLVQSQIASIVKFFQ